MLTEIEKFLSGKKTFGLVGLGLLIIAAAHLGWINIPQEQVNEFVSAITLASIAALRAGVK